MESGGGKIVGSGTSGAAAAAAAVGMRPTCAFTVPSVPRQHQSDEVTTSTSCRSAAASTSMDPPASSQAGLGTSRDAAAAATGSSSASYTTRGSGSVDGNDSDAARDTRRSALNATTGTGADTCGAPPVAGVAGIGTEESSVCYSRTAKVAKFRTSDHGSHGITDPSPDPGSISVADPTGSTTSSSDDRILKRMTQSLTTTYEGLGRHMVEQQISTCKSSGAAFVATLQQHRSSKSPSPGGGAFRSSKKRMSPSADSYDLRPTPAASDTVGVMERERAAGAQQRADASKASPLRSRLTTTATTSATASSSTTTRPTCQDKDGGMNTMEASSADTVDPVASTSDTGALTDAVDARRSSELTHNDQSQDLSKKRRGLLHAELQKGTAEEEAKSTSEPARPLAVAAAPSSSNVVPVESTSSRRHAGDAAGSGPSSVSVTVETTSSSSSETDKKEASKSDSCSKNNSNNSNKKNKNKEQCLTNPSVPASNGGLDNTDGNLIVRVGDVLRVPNRNVQVNKRRVGKVNTNGGAAEDSFATNLEDDNIIDIDDETVTEYEVLGLLGQGTFAQVFKCRVSGSGEIVAVKVVKNKPAYTRQAAVEIDVFRALSKEPPSAWSEDEKADESKEWEDRRQ